MKKLIPKKSKISKELEKIAKDVGEFKFMKDVEKIAFIPTIFSSFNRAVKLGGAPVSCIWIIHGPNAQGKTAMAVAMLVSFQRLGHIACFVDAEHTADINWFKSLGLDIEQTLYHQPGNFEETIQTIDRLIESYKDQDTGKYLAIVIDSVTRLVPKEELDEMPAGGRAYPKQALLMSSWLRRIIPKIGKSKIALILIAQERVNIGARPFQKQYKVTGGEALQFDNSVRLRVTQSSKLKEKDKVVGREHRFVVEKNKVGAPDEEGYFYTVNGKGELSIGFDPFREIVKEGIVQGKIKKHGATYEIGKLKFHGEAKLRRKLAEDPKFFERLYRRLNFNVVGKEGKIPI